MIEMLSFFFILVFLFDVFLHDYTFYFMVFFNNVSHNIYNYV